MSSSPWLDSTAICCSLSSKRDREPGATGVPRPKSGVSGSGKRVAATPPGDGSFVDSTCFECVVVVVVAAAASVRRIR